MAKYIVQQYVAAAGGEHALNSIGSMYAMGKVKMAASEFDAKVKNMRQGEGEIGGFVLWQKRPDLWSLDDAEVAWRQTPWHNSHASRGQPRPLRRSLQGLDPRLRANLFSNSICIRERSINGLDCFVLKLEAEARSLRARSSSNAEIMRHTLTLEGVNIAHAGRTCVSLFRFGEDSQGHTRTRMDEIWSAEEVDFNVKGLSIDSFSDEGR
ncbi:hypothetical protein SASPL_120772 [Salvia splendens]|uniref:Uncharacterized protein n=1 Tax=Salvia splendens TaxID=180675 RepID=A0A8X8XRD4_SALSN|nr:hypothetical protein SASPL_120772 [Salvia splendens]